VRYKRCCETDGVCGINRGRRTARRGFAGYVSSARETKM
jgi:hypothetical protein